jgi:hypothetical protein
MFGSFGKDNNGVYTYRVNTTTKEDIQLIIDAIIAAGAEFVENPEIGFKARTYHSLLRFQVPREDEDILISV